MICQTIIGKCIALLKNRPKGYLTKKAGSFLALPFLFWKEGKKTI